ncbi:hypothetical protein ALC56_06007 [Trachymyrmex septentrionalis]|uniref:Uncharacterized protein n=1 Tax=Trachymyrmex septentrionalis TaxID=34720 RepID=A0A195FHN3_9HYME|nr:hypothetical protein ALC56_06007 [Trachymyrmex septentrionalis]
MQQARLANAVECKAEVGLRAIAMRMGVQLSNEALHLTNNSREMSEGGEERGYEEGVVSALSPPHSRVVFR